MPYHILILNGPNLNMLGTREPEIYGTDTLTDIRTHCEKYATAHDMSVDFRQSNHEGQLIDWIQDAQHGFDGVIINAAAYTHTSIAIHDALKMLVIPIIEIHLSDPDTREKFRHISYIAPLAAKIIKGQGIKGYSAGLAYLAADLSTK